MAKRYLIGADIGTQGTKVALVSDEGEIVASAFQPSQLIRAAGGLVEQDPEEMFQSVVTGIHDVLLKSGVPGNEVAAIGLDGQMAGILAIDQEWNAITPYDSWLDTRCEASMPEVKAWGEEEFIRITGCPVTYAHGPKKIWWRTERPEVYKKIAKFLVPSAYAAGRLAGLKADQAFIDDTHLHFSGFADTANRRWSEDLLKAFRISQDKLPRIVHPWDVIGKLQGDYARVTGLPAGVPIVAGCGDTAATTLGAGIVQPGQIFDIAGTASVLSCCVDTYCPDTQSKTLIFARSVIQGLWTPLAYINGGGQCLAWFRELLVGKGEHSSFNELNKLAEEIDAGCDGLMFLPHFGGRVCPNNSDLRGSWIGVNWSHGKGAMFRSIMESIAYEYKYYLNILEQLTGSSSYSRVHVVGGGARSALFNSIKSDVLGIPYQTLNMPDTAMVANAVIAGFGIGMFSDIAETASRFATLEELYNPRDELSSLYASRAERYRIMLDGMAELYKKMK